MIGQQCRGIRSSPRVGTAGDVRRCTLQAKAGAELCRGCERRAAAVR